jgi:hypothetical protein
VVKAVRPRPRIRGEVRRLDGSLGITVEGFIGCGALHDGRSTPVTGPGLCWTARVGHGPIPDIAARDFGLPVARELDVAFDASYQRDVAGVVRIKGGAEGLWRADFPKSRPVLSDSRRCRGMHWLQFFRGYQ